MDLTSIIPSIPSEGIVVVGRFDFTGDGMDISYNTLLAAKAEARRAEKEI